MAGRAVASGFRRARTGCRQFRFGDCSATIPSAPRPLAETMFGLPIETLALLFGVPVLWIAYTLVFLAVSRKWSRSSHEPAER